MAFAPVVLLFAILALLYLFSDATPHVASAEDVRIQVVYLCLLLVAGVFWFAVRRRDGLVRLLGQTFGWTLIIGACVLVFDARDQASSLYLRIKEELNPAAPVSHGDGVVELARGFDGHFRAIASVEAARVSFLIDTGSSLVVLNHEDAVAAGFGPDDLVYSINVTTANGKARMAPITIGRLQVGDIEIFNVSAAVAEPGKLSSSLLGMSFLSQITETILRGDRLILRLDNSQPG
jgi:aspartyl protease family protein